MCQYSCGISDAMDQVQMNMIDLERKKNYDNDQITLDSVDHSWVWRYWRTIYEACNAFYRI